MKSLLAALLVFPIAACAWNWFGLAPDEDNTNAPPRLHRLLEKANEYIELAQDEAAQGEADKALDYYRQALDELSRVARENPDRVETPEFAPLRNKDATCRAAIDAIRFEQVNTNVRAVTITDTANLRKRWNKKHGIADPTNATAKATAPAAPPATAPVPAVTNRPSVAVSLPSPADAQPAKPVITPSATERQLVARRAARAAAPVDWDGRLQAALKMIQAGEYVQADVRLDGMLRERPNDLGALLLLAAAQTGSGARLAARRTLERAMRAHPKSPLPYYNLAALTLELGGNRDVARQYYEIGRQVGGAKNESLEKRIYAK